MQMSVALSRLVGGKDWVLRDLTVDWDDTGTSPTMAELEAEWGIHETEQAQHNSDMEQKAQDFIDHLPSWSAVSDTVDNIGSLADAKLFIKKLARVVYWLAKNQRN